MTKEVGAEASSFRGKTLSERCASYLKTIGLTDREISNIRAILFGDELAD